jgi:hypothetical protein
MYARCSEGLLLAHLHKRTFFTVLATSALCRKAHIV